ncbi:MAG: heat-inducible transcription repressor HrcA [Candidatus Zixiibacteriota bacterium]|nr:MAG: heat-inducible transcription repressor HrcA [candidate division Zixibacteria bacterium]
MAGHVKGEAMAFENLTKREREILANLIDYYVATADPVGSRVIANKYRMGISSATIRNTLQDLEELGLVKQPHTSAGRVPTDLGYRVYVDFLLKPENLTDDEKQFIKNSIIKEGRGINEILGQTCRVLGDITNQLGVSIAPRFEQGVLRAISLIPITGERLMVIVVVQSGLARSVIIEIEADIPDKVRREVEVVLNERLAGLTLGEIRDTISKRLADVSGHGKLIKLIIDSKDRIWTEGRSEDIHISGADHLVQQPEFADLRKVSDLIKILEDGKVLSDFLTQAVEEGLIITIGKENKFNQIMNCSLVTSSYRVGKVSGTIGIIGPTRMAYSKLVSVVEYTARTISEVLSGIDKHRKK